METTTAKVNNVVEGLSGTALQRAAETKTALITIKALNEVEVILTGTWDGRFIKASIRALERAYKGIKFDAMRAGIKLRQQKEQEEQKEKEMKEKKEKENLK